MRSATSSPSSDTHQRDVQQVLPGERTGSDFDVQGFIEAAGDAVIAVSPAGTIVLWNPAAERLFGRPAEFVLGKSLDLIIPEESRDAHWRGFRKVMKSGRTRLGKKVIRVPALHKDGHRIRVALTVAVLRDARSQITSLGAIIREDSVA